MQFSMDTIGHPLLSSSFQEGSTVLWFGFIVLSRTTLLPFSLLAGLFIPVHMLQSYLVGLKCS